MFWDSPQRWVIWATGKTVLGALLGGYLGVEVAKKCTGYSKATGDWFALIVPVGIAVGRIGCLMQGCCLREALPAGVVDDSRCARHFALARGARGNGVQSSGGARVSGAALALRVLPGPSIFICISSPMGFSGLSTNSCALHRG